LVKTDFGRYHSTNLGIRPTSKLFKKERLKKKETVWKEARIYFRFNGIYFQVVKPKGRFQGNFRRKKIPTNLGWYP